jgi:hypothetical protein
MNTWPWNRENGGKKGLRYASLQDGMASPLRYRLLSGRKHNLPTAIVDLHGEGWWGTPGPGNVGMESNQGARSISTPQVRLSSIQPNDRPVELLENAILVTENVASGELGFQ